MKRTITIKLPEEILESLDELIAMGVYRNRSEAIRSAVEELIKRDLLFPGIIRKRVGEKIA
uniref:Ribbon-helix-helix protein, CopG family n=1 Tax=Fervidicoccus fontis TaxID=683846 RepID=A0A7J3ZMJ7_9CREN